jgi:hypothetical protein
VGSQAFEIKVTSEENTEIADDFIKPVTLTFTYTEEQIKDFTEDTLSIYRWDAATGKWESLGGTVDPVNNTITVELLQFSLFAIVGEKSVVASVGDLIKLTCPANAGLNDPCRSVYFLGADGKRYVFPNATTYFSWYADFSGVKEVTAAELQSYPLGSNVTIRPGSYLVKITTDPKVYAVEPGGKLRWLASEAVARTLYGEDWATRVVDVPDAFFVNYDASQAVDNKVTAATKHPAGTLIKYPSASSIYYVDGVFKRAFVSWEAFVANGFRQEFVLTISEGIAYATGNQITGAEPELRTTAGPDF